MIISLLLAAALQTAQTPEVSPYLFATPFSVKNVDRLALSPKIDGIFSPEEWDPLAPLEGGEAYFQWEPKKINVAANLPLGKDMIVSLDLEGNGWLIGNDNLQVRVSWTGTTAVVAMAMLDGTNPSGPKWVEVPDFLKSVKSAATAGATNWSIELGLVDPGKRLLPRIANKEIGIRCDAVDSNVKELLPYLPRVVAPVQLRLERGVNLPVGLKWKPEFKGRSVVPGARIKVRFTFNGDNSLGMKRIEMRTEGLAEDATMLKAQPFPRFDNKGRAFVDYETMVANTAESGYRIVRATIQNAQGEPTVCQASYEIAFPVSFDLVLPKKLKSSDKAQTVRISVYIRSHVTGRIDGTFVAEPPTGWEAGRGNDKGFIIYASRGTVRKVFDMTVPAGAKGSYPIRLVADLGRGNVVEEVEYLEVK